MRKRKFIAPNNPTAQAKQVWRYIYGEPWPKGWRVEWVRSFGRRYSRRIGQCAWGARVISLHYPAHSKPDYREEHVNRTIYLGGPGLPQRTVNEGHWNPYTYPPTGPEILAYTVKRVPFTYSVIHTLIHEFTHARHRRLRHGKEFERLINWGMGKLGFKPDSYYV
jgi:hypothetical protein